MVGQYYSYLSPKVESRPNPRKGNCGIFCLESIPKDEIIALWGGRILAADEIDPEMPNFTQQVLQIEDEFFLMAPEMEPSDCFNHSCEPNAGMTGQIGLIAMRDIAVGEEVCFDYAMCDGSKYDEFDCSCGMPKCRGHISGEDWRRPELWHVYAGYFSPYLQRRIERLKHEVHQVHQPAQPS